MTTLVNPFMSFPTVGGGGGGSGTLSIAFEDDAYPVNSTTVTKNAVGSNGVVSGDLCVVVATATPTTGFAGAYGAPTAAGGGSFTALDTATGDTVEGASWYKVLAAGDTTIGLKGDPDFNGKGYQIWYIHSTTTAEIDGSNHVMHQGSPAQSPDTTVTWASAGTPSQDNCMILRWACLRDSGTSFTGVPSITVDQTVPGSTDWSARWAGHQLQTTATATGTPTMTLVGGNNSRFIDATIVVRAT